MPWPTSSEFQQAVQNPSLSFTDRELQDGTLNKNRITGMPLSWSGNFAVVFKMETSRGTKAVRCFTHNLPEQQRRYDSLHRYLTGGNAPATFEEFQYQPDGILIRGQNTPSSR